MSEKEINYVFHRVARFQTNHTVCQGIVVRFKNVSESNRYIHHLVIDMNLSDFYLIYFISSSFYHIW